MTTSFWNAATKYPVSKVLREVFKPKTWRVPKAPAFRSHSRVDIVSPSLCRDALEYIKEDLRSYKGCDIVDINPGACLWSQQINNVLQPRRHLLLEPEEAYYEPFIKPLLEQKDSTYRHTWMKPTHPNQYWSTYARIFDDHLLPSRPRLENDDPALRQPNRTLLLTGNLHRFYSTYEKKLKILGNARQVLGHLVHGAQTNSLIHQYGLVKMLLWVPSEVHDVLFPSALGRRSGRMLNMEMCADITDLVAPQKRILSDWTEHTQPQPYIFKDISNLRAIRGMEDRAMIAPTGRLDRGTLRVSENRQEIEQKAERLDVTKDFKKTLSYAELKSQVEDLEKHVLAFKKNSDEHKVIELKEEAVSQKNAAFLSGDIYEPVQVPVKNHFATYMRLSIQQITLEAQFCGSSSAWTASQTSHLEKELLKTAAGLRDGLLGVGTLEWRLWATRVTGLFNEQVALFQNPPTLAIDKRAYSPLTAEADEFWPQLPCVLLDIDPLTRDFSSDIVSKNEAASVMRTFVRGINQWKGSTLEEAIDHFTMDASEDLFKAIPELRDPRHGGRLDSRDLFVKTLGRELLDKLVAAYLEWPFRPHESQFATEDENHAGTEEGEGIEGAEADDPDDDA